MNIRVGGKQTGFTVVELLIVMVVIGILAILALNTIGGAQARGRDTERITDIRALQKSLEVYYLSNNGYPDLGAINGSLFPGLNAQSLIDPFGRTFGDSNADYSYTSTDCVTGSHCNNFQLVSNMEKQDTYTVQSINGN